MNIGILLINVWVLVGLALAVLLLKLIDPKMSYLARTSLILGWIGAFVFAAETVAFTAFEMYPDLVSPIILCLVCASFIKSGGRSVAFKTMTGVQSLVNNQFVGRMSAGAFNWADPIFEKTTISTDGKPNISADLQVLTIELPETPYIKTKNRGIKARVMHTLFDLELIETDAFWLFRIEGGGATIRKRILNEIAEFYIHELGKLEPEKLDADKHNTIQNLARDLAIKVNTYCGKNKYPYAIKDEVTIGDTELEKAYDDALSEKEFAILKNKAKDIDADALTERLLKAGKKFLPKGTDAEQIHAAKVAQGIIKVNEDKKTYGIDPDSKDSLTEILKFLKK